MVVSLTIGRSHTAKMQGKVVVAVDAPYARRTGYMVLESESAVRLRGRFPVRGLECGLPFHKPQAPNKNMGT